jgi:glycosyltransferase involved in cell wall biosynthesis
MKKSIIKYQSYNSNFDIIHFPNWIRNFKSISDSKKYQDLVPNGFNIMLAGNIGVSIDYSNIIRAAKLLNNYEKINFLIVGSGSQEFKFKSEVNNCGLSNKIFFLGRYQNDEMPHFYVHADLMLISLADNELYSYTVPEKLQSYMSMKKTIIGMVSGESNQLIKKSGAGLSSNAGDYKALADNIRVLYEMSEVDRNKFGEKGYKYALDNFDLSKNINHILN